jgi:hypothetical protein
MINMPWKDFGVLLIPIVSIVFLLGGLYGAEKKQNKKI